MGNLLGRLAALGGFCVVGALILLGSYYTADHDRRHGGQMSDQGWEDVAIVGLGALVAVMPGLAIGILLGRPPRGKVLASAGVAGFVAVVAWWSWITTIVD